MGKEKKRIRMKTITKTFSLLGFCMDMGREWVLESKNKFVKHRAKYFLKAARQAAEHYPSSTLKGNQLNTVQSKIIELKKFEISQDPEKNMTAILSVILCGVDDILSHTKNPKTRELFEKLQQMTNWLNALPDPKLDKTADYIKGDFIYNQWTKEKIWGK